MNNTMYHHAGLDLDILYKTIETPALEDLYSTTPLKTIRSKYRRPDEDELHSSFEEAISDRVLALNQRHKTMSDSRAENFASLPSIQTTPLVSNNATHSTMPRPGTREFIFLAAIALMLVLVGFDLMGLLVILTSP